MKKIIPIITAAILVLALSLPSFANSEISYANGYAEDGEISVGYHEYSTFTISIPTYISRDTDASISVINSNMEDGMGIVISATNLASDGTITLTHTTDASKTVKSHIISAYRTVTASEPELAKFSHADLANGSNLVAYISPQIDGVAPKAGDYTGTLCYHIDCVPM